MKKFQWLILLIAITLAGVQKGFAQDIEPVSGTSGQLYDGNQVFDAAGNMYFISSNATISVMSAATGSINLYAGTSGTIGYSNGTGSALSATLSSPVYLAMDNLGNLPLVEGFPSAHHSVSIRFRNPQVLHRI